MFWRRSDREKVEGPADFLPVKDEAADADLVEAPGAIIAIEWLGPFGHEADKAESAFQGKPLVFVVTDLPAADAAESVERVGFSKTGDAGYVKTRMPGQHARAWIGVVQNLDGLDGATPEAFAPGDPDAPDIAAFDPHLALVRRAFSSLLRPRLARILAAPEPLPPPVQIRNLWASRSAEPHAFPNYCPGTIRFFKNGKVRLAWDDQARFLAWTRRTRPQAALAANLQDRFETEPQRASPWPLLIGAIAGAAIIGLVSLALRTQEPEATHLKQLLGAAEQKIEALTTALQKATAQAQALKTELSLALARITQLEQENQTLKSGGAGIELQSCWSREGQRILPVYRIAIEDGGFLVEPSWKGSETGWPAPFAARMGGLTPIASPARYAPAAFAAAMAPYYALGQKPEMNCRFFVEVTDRTSGKEAWKSGLATVERYFYKRLVP